MDQPPQPKKRIRDYIRDFGPTVVTIARLLLEHWWR